MAPVLFSILNESLPHKMRIVPNIGLLDPFSLNWESKYCLCLPAQVCESRLTHARYVLLCVEWEKIAVEALRLRVMGLRVRAAFGRDDAKRTAPKEVEAGDDQTLDCGVDCDVPISELRPGAHLSSELKNVSVRLTAHHTRSVDEASALLTHSRR